MSDKIQTGDFYPTYPIYPKIDKQQNITYHLQPHRCPICGGNGIVPSGFYNQTNGTWSSTNTTEQCRSCKGSGIIWG